MIHPVLSSRPSDTTRRSAALRRAAVQAAQAPSVLNTQPWTLRIHDGALHVHADHDRQLAALDPQRRVLVTSVGCAVFAARSSLAVDGYAAVVHRFPEPTMPDLAAVIELDEARPVDASLPRPSTPPGTPVPSAADLPADLVDALRAAATAEGVELQVLGPLERDVVSGLSRQADAIENLDPAYRAELDAWGSGDRPERVAAPAECLALLVAGGDTPLDWLRTGEALMRALQVAAGAGHVVMPSTQIVEVPSARAHLRRALGLSGHAHVLLRAGGVYPVTTRRRRLVDVLVEES